MARIIDISPPLRVGMPVWPGDTAFEAARSWAISAACPVNVSRLVLSTHSGAHADAPLHYSADGGGAETLELSRFLGRARLIDLRGLGSCVEPRHLLPHLGGAPSRILLRTYERAPLEHWDSAFTAIAAASIDCLADAGVQLIGVDTASLDPETSKTLDAHQAVHRRGLSILEGLVFDDVDAGDYELIALPLKLVGLDAAPVRAVLRTLDDAD